jgi:hypothetical protein
VKLVASLWVVDHFFSLAEKVEQDAAAGGQYGDACNLCQ